MNLFKNELCPTGGWRTHCPRSRRGKCLYRHHDDSKFQDVEPKPHPMRRLTRGQKANEDAGKVQEPPIETERQPKTMKNHRQRKEKKRSRSRTQIDKIIIDLNNNSIRILEDNKIEANCVPMLSNKELEALFRKKEELKTTLATKDDDGAKDDLEEEIEKVEEKIANVCSQKNKEITNFMMRIYCS